MDTYTKNQVDSLGELCLAVARWGMPETQGWGRIHAILDTMHDKDLVQSDNSYEVIDRLIKRVELFMSLGFEDSAFMLRETICEYRMRCSVLHVGG